MTLEVLATVLKRVGGFDPKEFASDFDARLRLQKAIYLLEEGFEVDLGYPFNYYLRGPYSTALAKDAYSLTQDLIDTTEVRKFKNSEVESRFQRFRTFIQPHITDADWLETAATILWHVTRGTTEISALCAKMEAKGKPIDDEYCRQVLDNLRQEHLIAG